MKSNKNINRRKALKTMALGSGAYFTVVKIDKKIEIQKLLLLK